MLKFKAKHELTTPQAIFCDRDGTLIQDCHFLSHPDQIDWIPGVLDALKILKSQSIQVIVVTNQSGVARGYFGVDSVEAVNNKIRHDIESRGGSILDFYYCPHHPQGTVMQYSYPCNCRKPSPGMFMQALQDHHLDPDQCWVIGDRLRDLEPGLQLGMKAFLVRTGYGIESHKLLLESQKTKQISVISSVAEIVSFLGRDDYSVPVKSDTRDLTY